MGLLRPFLVFVNNGHVHGFMISLSITRGAFQNIVHHVFLSKPLTSRSFIVSLLLLTVSPSLPVFLSNSFPFNQCFVYMLGRCLSLGNARVRWNKGKPPYYCFFRFPLDRPAQTQFFEKISLLLLWH